MTSLAASGVGSAMAPEAMREYLRERLEAAVTGDKIAYGQLTLDVTPEAWVNAARLVKEDPALACDFFDWLTAVDRSETGFEIVLHVYSVRHRHHVTLRTTAAGREAPTVPSLAGVYRGANWHEREAFDMFGILFEGHPGLEPRILTVENFEGHPLRKDFQLTSRNAKPWPGAKEPEERHDDEGAAAAGGPKIGRAHV